MSRPYRTIAVAATFSPRFLQVLAEAKRVRDRLGSELDLIFVGDKTDAALERFRAAFEELALPLESRIHFERGEDAAAAILGIAENLGLELLVAGALEKEAVLLPFLGNVARRLVRDSRASVMLFTKPEQNPRPFARIVFMADYSTHALDALRTTLALAEAEKCERLYVVRVYTSFDEARAGRGEEGALTLDEEERALEKFVLSAGATEVPIEARCIRGNTGYAALDFVRAIDANLLVVPIDDRVTRELPPHIAWIAETIPCNLWVIRPGNERTGV